MQINNEKLKFISISQTTRNFIIVISRVNNDYQYIIMFTLTVLNNNTSTSDFTFAIFYNISIFFTFLLNSSLFTSIFVNKLIIDLTTQKTRLLNASSVENVKIELKRAFNYYTKLRLTKNFSVNSLIGFVALFNCNSIVIKIALTLFVKVSFTNLYKSKLYKKVIIDA